MPVPIIIARSVLAVALFGALILAPAVYGQPSKAATAPEWDKLVDAARKEGKVTVSLPASAELKRQIEEQFKKRYGIEVEVFTARGSTGVRRMADEFKAGVRYFDLHIGGSSSIISGMLDEGIIDAIDPWLVLPEVRDPKAVVGRPSVGRHCQTLCLHVPSLSAGEYLVQHRSGQAE